jgi:hypothetical protein
MIDATMQTFIDSLPPGTYVSVEALRAWWASGKGPSEGGLLAISAAEWLTDEQYRIWLESLPHAGVKAVEREALAVA